MIMIRITAVNKLFPIDSSILFGTTDSELKLPVQLSRLNCAVLKSLKFYPTKSQFVFTAVSVRWKLCSVLVHQINKPK